MRSCVCVWFIGCGSLWLCLSALCAQPRCRYLSTLTWIQVAWGAYTAERWSVLCIVCCCQSYGKSPEATTGQYGFSRKGTIHRNFPCIDPHSHNRAENTRAHTPLHDAHFGYFGNKYIDTPHIYRCRIVYKTIHCVHFLFLCVDRPFVVRCKHAHSILLFLFYISIRLLAHTLIFPLLLLLLSYWSSMQRLVFDPNGMEEKKSNAFLLFIILCYVTEMATETKKHGQNGGKKKQRIWKKPRAPMMNLKCVSLLEIQLSWSGNSKRLPLCALQPHHAMRCAKTRSRREETT